MTPFEFTPEAISAIWHKSPWGMAAIDGEGKICALNPAFERCTRISPLAMIGMSEADFDHLMKSIYLVERHRVEVSGGNLRAVHYLRCSGCAADEQQPDRRLANIAEVLREPLASIYGFAELLLTQHYDETTRQDLTEMLLGQTEVMANLINERMDSAVDKSFSNPLNTRK